MHQILTKPQLQKLHNTFQSAGFELRLVGGVVRDILLGVEPKDIDLCTDATPEEMIEIAASCGMTLIPTGLQHGTVTFVLDQEAFEITTLRIDVATDGRHADVEFTRSFKQDAERRDLTINAMSMDFSGNIYDYFGGYEDLKNTGGVRIRFVGNASKRIEEDYLRMLRYYRFAARFNYFIPWDTIELFEEPENLEGLSKISKERVWMEMSKILTSTSRSGVMECLFLASMHTAIGLPEPKMHLYDALELVERSDDAITALSVFVTAETAEAFAKSWKLSREEQLKLVWLAKQQSTFAYSLERVQDMLVDGVNRNWVISRLKLLEQNDLALYAFTYEIPVFPIKGQDLLDRGYAPGKEIGEILSRVRDVWMTSRFTMDRSLLLETF